MLVIVYLLLELSQSLIVLSTRGGFPPEVDPFYSSLR